MQGAQSFPMGNDAARAREVDAIRAFTFLVDGQHASISLEKLLRLEWHSTLAR
ncbi:hypothetical protein IE81DRAFT_321784 [Ceraceosorus guamensis]|uniref:Uncharacterized protein n=1 Tax=Ceraceosorus guamensis TaxID=1522189 RepID=A0A316W349_9BASI|nr:hypothetical protein IE81DRAFT_321784 [Ceraceosorus guamensis]PWN44119.1 hypothetical protein IE81DRAFT_321784 [Ceraceosorus guamensis]